MSRKKGPGSSLFEVRDGDTAPTDRSTEVVPAAVMKRAHREKLQLGDALERIADALPSVDRLKCLGTANAIVPLLRDIHRYEETVIFPAYEEAVVG
ncbi:hemerythrin domain-containing protein, partial [Mesorhizobium sp. M4B.F.Ca.ET.200.01.1.1]|uniref:hemerythrin domain-containing protein n=1 Tax=Mesorhizobium sp. M4B.F.Ca.ET.200.01.1.1 TaxID=2563952 RepID=UPI001FE15D20